MTKALPLLSLSLLSLLVGCASPAEDAPEQSEHAPQEVDVARTSQALVSPEYESADDDVNLWNTGLAFCYLTSVSGDLLPRTGMFEIGRGVGLGVRDGIWHLSSYGVSARARCAQWGDFKYAGTGKLTSSPHGWDVRDGAEHGLWGANTLCFLSGAGQGYDGGAQRFDVTRGSGAWFASSKGMNGAYASGDAMCVDTQRSTPWRLSTYAWSQGSPQTWMMKSSEGVCMLTGIGGRFAGGGERVEIVEDSGYWVLRGHSRQHGVQATAQCVPYSQLVLTKPIVLSPIGG